jgi:hypothetical protein
MIVWITHAKVGHRQVPTKQKAPAQNRGFLHFIMYIATARPRRRKHGAVRDDNLQSYPYGPDTQHSPNYCPGPWRAYGNGAAWGGDPMFSLRAARD